MIIIIIQTVPFCAEVPNIYNFLLKTFQDLLREAA